MTAFLFHFLLCNLNIGAAASLLLLPRRLLSQVFTSRTQYALWYLFLGLLALPFLPISSAGRLPAPLSPAFWLQNLTGRLLRTADAANLTGGSASYTSATVRLQDFALSVSQNAPSAVWLGLGFLWLAGVLAALLRIGKAARRLRLLHQSAHPLQQEALLRLYRRCLSDMRIARNIPLYETAFLKSPIMAGMFQPRIYLPLCMARSAGNDALRYMLLHELQHYKQRDAFVNHLVNLASALYWWNPLVMRALRAMRDDRETACDAAVLSRLDAADYGPYGHTLLHMAENVSATPFPFFAGLGSRPAQLERRIRRIAAYQKPTRRLRLKSGIAFGLTAILLLGFIPALSTRAAGNVYAWHPPEQRVTALELDNYFNSLEGSFVLYEPQTDSYRIYREENAVRRASPNSTYKIYDALFGLSEGIITPEASYLPWDKTPYPFEAWNRGQTLQSALKNSVNWYFQDMDWQMGRARLSRHIRGLGYGNENLSGSLSSYWLESSLKISPLEQVSLLSQLWENGLDFAPEHVQAVKDALRLSASPDGVLYGKTGTGRVNGEDINGWFVGVLESSEHTYIFAVHIQGPQNASGSRAAKIALSVLAQEGIWQPA